MKKTKVKNNLKRNEMGITLMALVVTIVILLILAGVTIGVLTGENGLIKNAIKGKTNSEIAKEKEVVEISTIKAIEKEKYGNLEKQKLQEAIDKTIGENSTRTDYGDIIGNGEIEELLIELTTGKGWIPIGGYDVEGRIGMFGGNFNGNNNKISNLYINNEEEKSNSGLFGFTNSKIKDLGVEGDIYCNSGAAGGIISSQSINNEGNIINNCYFNGNIKNIHTTGKTGGIAGILYQGTINSCYVKGSIIGNNTDGGSNGTGGIIGIALGVGTVIIENSYNEAEVTGVSRVGGICGSGSTEINNSYNTGDIKGTSNVGGISGYSCIDKISNCYNTGEIVATDVNIGGIAGTIYATTNSKIYQCYNSGIIKGASKTGGILGYIYSSNYLTIEQCYNLKEVTGTTWTAGIVGNIGGQNAHIINCYNIGTINGTQVAGIGVGGSVANGTTAKTVSCYNIGRLNGTTKVGVVNCGVVSNSYYVETCGATDTIAVSITEESLKTLANTLDKTFEIDDEQNTITINEEGQGVWEEDTNNINNGYPTLKWQEE